MKVKIAKSFVILAIVTSLLVVSGCLLSLGRQDVSAPGGNTPTPAAAGTPTPLPGGYPTPDGAGWVPGDATMDNYTQLYPSPVPGSNGTSPTGSPTPQPVVSAQAKDWGTSKSVYARGETATGWVYVTNTGNVPIDTVDFTIAIKKTIFFVPIEKSYSYSKNGLNIQPGETQRVEFSQSIPSEYSGMSTAGDYQLKVTALLAGKEIGSYSGSMKVV